MQKDLTLVIMAAGMGNRFGGLKQIEAMGPNDEFIIDYSIYDAILAGFTKIIFIIKKENFEIFKKTIGSRVEDKIKVEYVFQELNNIPQGYTIPDERQKPLGTAQAILCCKEYVQTPFMIINADDFYGRDAYFKASEYLKTVDKEGTDYAMVAYHAKNTLSENGAAKRAICMIENNHLVDLIESSVERKENKIIASPFSNIPAFEIEENQTVSMNMLLFTPTIFHFIEENFLNFLTENKENLLTAEYLIPDLLQKLIKGKKAKVKILETTSTWYGVTYKEDKESVQKAILQLITDGIYPEKLWSKYE